jgi:hypothetical protein
MGMIEERNELWARWRDMAASDFGTDAVEAAWLAAQEIGRDVEIGTVWLDAGLITYRITPDGYVWGEASS